MPGDMLEDRDAVGRHAAEERGPGLEAYGAFSVDVFAPLGSIDSSTDIRNDLTVYVLQAHTDPEDQLAPAMYAVRSGA